MLVSAFTALVVLFLGHVDAQNTAASPCAVGCVDGVFANTANLGCGVGDRLCMCGRSGDLFNGIRDCVNQACASEAAAQADMAEQYGKDICAALSSSAGLPATTPAATPAPEPTTSPSPTAAETTPEITPAPSPTNEGATSEVAADTVEPTTGSTATSPTPAAEISETPDSSTSTSDPITISDSTASGTSSATAAATVAASNDDGTDDEGSSSNGLPVAVKAGIGAGAGVAIIMTAIIALCLCMRRRRGKEATRRGAKARSLKISDPLPGSGRQYAPDVRSSEIGMAKTYTGTPSSIYPTSPKYPYSPSKESYSSQLDMNARRYEDLEPHTQPRTMI
ncbi:hypothetical protein F5X99DRAFT_242108 [Biscogniauxia marginata]|nr:hypothetical protein F5X99DRAFT_242108 [Biscogniauxia marginata]